jgi:hypothetical protein
MFTPLLHITLPEDDGEDRHFAPILLALEAMCAINTWHIKRALKRAEKGEGVPFPPLYASGVRYEEDKPGREDWRDCYEVLKRGKGDCDQLVAWRVGELRARGVWAEPVVKWQQVPKDMMVKLGHPAAMVPETGISMIHCSVRLPDGRIEDVSKNLGMGGNFTNKV